VDIVVAGDGRWTWKDREHVAEQVSAGRLTADEAADVWRETDRAVAELHRGPESWWWAAWSDWRPPAVPMS
jgi:predicted RNA-binding protein associated with RNAse of E/G family